MAVRQHPHDRQHHNESMKSDRIKNWPKEECPQERLVATRVSR